MPKSEDKNVPGRKISPSIVSVLIEVLSRPLAMANRRC